MRCGAVRQRLMERRFQTEAWLRALRTAARTATVQPVRRSTKVSAADVMRKLEKDLESES